MSENGKYIIKVIFFEIEKSFSLVLNIPKNNDKKEPGTTLFTEKWYEEATALVSSNEDHSNILSVLKCLNDYNDISKNSDSFIVVAFLIRVLVEYTSKAYWNKCRSGMERPKELPRLISNISTHLYNQKIIDKEEKKSFANGNDLETLNGQIHDYKSNVSLITIDTIFKSYKNYLNKLFVEINR